jgi:hypothetical protein
MQTAIKTQVNSDTCEYPLILRRKISGRQKRAAGMPIEHGFEKVVLELKVHRSLAE